MLDNCSSYGCLVTLLYENAETKQVRSHVEPRQSDSVETLNNQSGKQPVRPRVGPASSGVRPNSARTSATQQGRPVEDTSSPPPPSAHAIQPQQQQQPQMMISQQPGNSQGWRVASHPMEQHPQLYHPGAVQVAGYHPGQPNRNYILLSRNPMVPQGIPGMLTFVNEDGTIQHAMPQQAMPPQAMPQQAMPQQAMSQQTIPQHAMPQGYPMHPVMESNGTTDQQVMPFPPLIGSQTQLIPGSNVVFIPPGSFVTSPATEASKGQSGPARQVVGGPVPEQERWVQTGVDSNGVAIMQERVTPSSPSRAESQAGRVMAEQGGAIQQQGQHQMIPNVQYNYQMFHPPQQFAGSHPQFIAGYPHGMPFTTQGIVGLPQQYDYFAPSGQFQSPQGAHQQTMNYQGSQV